MRELFNIDTAKNRKGKEEIYGFTLGLSLETSVNELLHPNPLPKGLMKIEHLNASFKRYPHTFHEFAAELTHRRYHAAIEKFWRAYRQL